nr:MAG TPA: hypothetical protein [Caudoviricetes sp.]
MNLQELRELSHRVDDPRELALYVLKNYTQSEDIHEFTRIKGVIT